MLRELPFNKSLFLKGDKKSKTIYAVMTLKYFLIEIQQFHFIELNIMLEISKLFIS